MSTIRTFELMIDVPFLNKGMIIIMYDRTGEVFWIDGEKKTEYPLRPSLAGYLWLLCTDNKYMKEIDFDYDV